MVDFSFPIDGFISILDYLGTIAFAVTGASKAIAHKADIFGIIVLATVVGVGGGVTCDVFVREIPIVFVKEVYAIASVIGIVLFYLLLLLGVDVQVSSIIGIVAATGIRLFATKYNWNLPKVRET